MTDQNRETEQVTITYTAAANLRDGCGFLPIVTSSVGDNIGNTWQGAGYDKDEALGMALAMAEELASRFLGDYKVTIEASR